MRLRTPVWWLGLAVVAAGCQRLPGDTPSTGGGETGESGTTFLPGDGGPSADGSSGTGASAGDGAATGTGEPTPPPPECMPGSSIDSAMDVASLGGVEAVEGDVRLSSLIDHDLLWLHCLQRVGGDLSVVYSPEITGLHGLEALQVVEGTLELSWNDGLVDVDGLAGVRELGGLRMWSNDGLRMWSNDGLQSLAGLEGLETVGDLEIHGSPLLERLALPLVTETGALSLHRDDALAELELPQLTRIGGRLYIQRNPSLTDLDDLAGVEEVMYGVLIANMDGLQTTAGLASLREVGTFLHLQHNPLLAELALPALERVEELAVRDAPVLTDLALPSLQQVDTLVLASLPAFVAFPSFAAIDGPTHIGLFELPALVDLDWLGPLPPAMGWVHLLHDPALSDLQALSVVTTVDETVELDDLPGLATLEGLSGLDTIGGRLVLRDLPQVTGLTELAGLQQLGSGPLALRGLRIDDLDALGSLQGLEGLTTIGGEVRLRDNDGLSSLTGLDALTSIDGGWLHIENNPALLSLEGLQALEDVGAGIVIVDNSALASIDAIWPVPTGVLQSVGPSPLTITGNASLSQCSVDDFVDALMATGWLDFVTVGGNLPCPE